MSVRRVVLGAAVAGTAVVVLVMGSVVGMAGTIATVVSAEESGDDGSSSQQCVTTVTTGRRTTLTSEQRQNAATIISVGLSMDVPERGLVVAIATAMQESRLRNLDYGDRDSVGLFQQRPSSGWGTVAELTTPKIAARKFYRALLQVDGWQSMAVTVAAQTVQRSAYPNAYAQWETLAHTVVANSSSVTTVSASDTAAACGELADGTSSGSYGSEMVQAALEQLGEPYVWGATGPDSFDCSGLVVYSWRQVGYRLSIRTADQMYRNSTTVQAGEEKPGDLLFGSFDSAGTAHHVMIVVRKGTAVEAPQTGDVVKVVQYSTKSWKIGRLKSGVMTKTG